ncbi:MAG TPA: hypothetical protein PLE01_01500, partial [Syntrophothermus lipocalidus]|nr:hypothetical protein [Syntrophothermus lipocalidus]
VLEEDPDTLFHAQPRLRKAEAEKPLHSDTVMKILQEGGSLSYLYLRYQAANDVADHIKMAVKCVLPERAYGVLKKVRRRKG